MSGYLPLSANQIRGLIEKMQMLTKVVQLEHLVLIPEFQKSIINT